MQDCGCFIQPKPANTCANGGKAFATNPVVCVAFGG